MKKKIILALLCATLGISAVACSQQNNQSKSEENTKVAEQKQTDENKDNVEQSKDFAKLAQEYFVNEDDALKSFGLEEKGMSVIALGWTDNLFLLDAGVNILALPDNHHIPENILEKYPHFTDHDGNIDYSKIEELKPQVIISSKANIEKDEKLKEVVGKLNAKVVEIPTRKTYNDVLKSIAITSTVFGNEDTAKESIAKYLQRVDDAKTLGNGSDKRNVAVINVNTDGQFILGKDNFVDSILDELELKNVAENMELTGEADKFGFYKSPDMTKIAEAKPDSLVIMVRIKGDTEAKKAKTQEVIDSITKAFGENSDLVKNKKYKIVDHHGLIIACPMAISGLESVASIAFE